MGDGESGEERERKVRWARAEEKEGCATREERRDRRKERSREKAEKRVEAGKGRTRTQKAQGDKTENEGENR